MSPQTPQTSPHPLTEHQIDAWIGKICDLLGVDYTALDRTTQTTLVSTLNHIATPLIPDESERPDLYYDKENAEHGSFDNINDLTQDFDFGEIWTIGCLKELPDQYAVQKITDRYDDGAPADHEWVLVATVEEAETIVKTHTTTEA